MITTLTIIMILAVGYAFFLQGALTAFSMLVNVILSGFIAFNFWEPIADQLEPMLMGTFVQGFEDWAALMGLFTICLAALRFATNSIVPIELEMPAAVQQSGAVVCGLLTGYLLSGFLVCVFQTLPWQENFLGFNSTIEEPAGMRRFFPADRVWLALVRRGSMGPLTVGEDGFDPNGSFEVRYQRHRRFTDSREVLPYGGDDLPLEYTAKVLP